jgi:spectrin beta
MSHFFFQSLRTEIDNHEPRIHLVCNNGQKLIDEGHESSPEFNRLIEELMQKWEELKDAVENRKNNLMQSEKAQQVCFYSYGLYNYCGFLLACILEG